MKIYFVGSKLLYDIKSMYVHSLACMKVKRGESVCFRIGLGMFEYSEVLLKKFKEFLIN